MIEESRVVDVHSFCFAFSYIYGTSHNFLTNGGHRCWDHVLSVTPVQVWGGVADGRYLKIFKLAKTEMVEVVELSEYLVFGCLEGWWILRTDPWVQYRIYSVLSTVTLK